jgi:hypothetical protein
MTPPSLCKISQNASFCKKHSRFSLAAPKGRERERERERESKRETERERVRENDREVEKGGVREKERIAEMEREGGRQK